MNTLTLGVLILLISSPLQLHVFTINDNRKRRPCGGHRRFKGKQDFKETPQARCKKVLFNFI